MVQVYVAKEVGQPHGKELLKTGASLLVRGTLSETPEGALPLRSSARPSSHSTRLPCHDPDPVSLRQQQLLGAPALGPLALTRL